MINSFVINQDLTLKDALISIEKNNHRSLVVINDDNKIVGTLSDGDIRKALINDIVLSANIYKVMNKDFYSTKNTLSQSDANKLMEFKNIFLLPLIDNEKNLIDIYVKEL